MTLGGTLSEPSQGIGDRRRRGRPKGRGEGGGGARGGGHVVVGRALGGSRGGVAACDGVTWTVTPRRSRGHAVTWRHARALGSGHVTPSFLASSAIRLSPRLRLPPSPPLLRSGPCL